LIPRPVKGFSQAFEAGDRHNCACAGPMFLSRDMSWLQLVVRLPRL